MKINFYPEVNDLSEKEQINQKLPSQGRVMSHVPGEITKGKHRKKGPYTECPGLNHPWICSWERK